MTPAGNFAEAFDISDAFGSAIDHVRRVPGVAFVGGFLTMCTESSNNNLDIPNFSSEEPGGLLIAGITGVFFLLGVVQFFLAPFVSSGFILAQKEVVDDRQPELSILFSGGLFYMRLLGWQCLWLFAILVACAPLIGAAFYLVGQEDLPDSFLLIFGVVGVAGLLLFALFVFAWLGFSLTTRLIVCEDMRTLEAARTSWSLTSGHRLNLFLFGLVGALFGLAGTLGGLILCCVGVLVVYPFAVAVKELAWTRAYLWFVHGDAAQRTAALEDVFR